MKDMLPKVQRAGSLKGKRVLVRVDFNVPVKNHHVKDAYRIMRALPTIEYLKKKKARIVLVSHIGRDPNETLRPVANYLNRKYNFKVGYVPDPLHDEVPLMIDSLSEGGVLLLGNVRKYAGEVENDTAFAKRLASYADVYVNDAFGVAHRKHASVVGIPRYVPSYAGLLLQEEVKHLSKILEPKHPFLFVIGGAKIATKMPLLRKYARIADTVFVGGALANDIYMARGYNIGKSLVDSDVKGLSALARRKNIVVPEDVVVMSGTKNGTNVTLGELNDESVIVDAGRKTTRGFPEFIKPYRLIVFNGPLGNYEAGYDKATRALLKAIADTKRCVSIIGGGDTVALVSKLKLTDAFSFVSTGGGAMLSFLAHNGKLPGISALISCKHIKQ